MSGERPLLRTVTAAFPGPTQPRRAHFIELLHRELAPYFRSEIVAPRVLAEDPLREERGPLALRRFPYPSRNLPAKSARLGPIAWWRYLRAGERCALDWWRHPQGAETGGAVVAHWVVPAGWIAARVARKLGLPLVLFAHGSDLHRYARRPGLRTAVRRVLRAATLTIAASDELGEIAARLGGRSRQSIPVIPAGIDAEFTPSEAPRLPPPPWRFLFAGDLIAQKGFADAAHAILALAERGLPVELEALGAGPLAPGFAGAGPALRLAGEGSLSAVRDAMRRAHFLLLPSRGEGTPLVVQEAIAVRLPVIATRVGGIPALFERRAGWIPLAARLPEEQLRAALAAQVAAGPSAWRALEAAMAANEVASLYAARRAAGVAAALRSALS